MARFRTIRWPRILLVASLSLNLILVGLILGAARYNPPPRLAGPPGEFRLLERAMPEDARKALRAEMRRNGAHFKARGEALQVIRRDMIAALRRDPFDEAEMQRVFTAQRTFWKDLGQDAQALMLRQISEMSPEARAQLAANLETWRARRKDRQKDKTGGRSDASR